MKNKEHTKEEQLTGNEPIFTGLNELCEKANLPKIGTVEFNNMCAEFFGGSKKLNKQESEILEQSFEKSLKSTSKREELKEELHTCQHCGVETTQYDSECYKAPKESLESKVRNLFNPIKNYIALSRQLLSDSEDKKLVKIAQEEGLRADQNIYLIISEIHNCEQPKEEVDVWRDVERILYNHDQSIGTKVAMLKAKFTLTKKQ